VLARVASLNGGGDVVVTPSPKGGSYDIVKLGNKTIGYVNHSARGLRVQATRLTLDDLPENQREHFTQAKPTIVQTTVASKGDIARATTAIRLALKAIAPNGEEA
jgi:hypothetical protein